MVSDKLSVVYHLRAKRPVGSALFLVVFMTCLGVNRKATNAPYPKCRTEAARGSSEKMPLTNKDQLTIEKSPAYFHSKTAAERIRALNPAMKIIVVVRDPVMRAISDYTQASSKRKTIGMMPTFEDMAVGDCAPWLRTNCSSKVGGVNVGWGAIRIGVYHKHMKRWLDNFPMEQIHIVDVVKPEHFGVDPVKKFPCVRRPDASLHCLGKTKGRKHPHVRPEVLQRLRRFYAPENQKFFRMINRSLAW
ncbi:unnamed protein product [Nippostrongylus brasiliensis]|uniref:Sulfotransfer_1 domain-containing protein n=1 Tax=Nippostrongylus brasiliensis TaxID=27835 RepID=A0A0N4Y4S2_NIPBR|nr:unnamed protein product [Nippostrongylus brasiliensis]